MEHLESELAGAARACRDGNDRRVEPARATASPLWLGGDNAWTLTVGSSNWLLRALPRARIEEGRFARTPIPSRRIAHTVTYRP